jgi:DNA-directed RNA polymerase specialized sigma subunit
MDDPVLRDLLALRYISGLTFEQTAERLFYSWRQIMNLHGKALDSLEIDF